MGVDSDEARKALDEIESTRRRVYKRLISKGPDAIYAVWGLIWVIAFTFQQFVPGEIASGPAKIPVATLIWSPLALIGIVATFFIMKRRSPAAGPVDRRVGALWGIAFGYFYVWMFVLMPLVSRDALFSARGFMLTTAAVSIVPMFVYVIMGLWGYGSYMIWLGLSVTVATIIGLVALPAFFYLWMAVVGGGALFTTGILLKRNWARA